LPKAGRSKIADKPREVAEMMGRRGVGHARFARNSAQRQPGKPVAF
jgi:hypothetical protein